MICGKVLYETRKAAVDAIRGMNTDTRVKRSNLQPDKVYFCVQCNGWHLFTESKRRKKAKKPQEKTSLWNHRPRHFNELTIHTKMKIK